MISLIVVLLGVVLPLWCQNDSPELQNTFCTKKPEQKTLLYSEDFNDHHCNWRSEFEIPDQSSMRLVDGKLDVIAAKGATIWYKNLLKGNISIEYEIWVVDSGGTYDRISDMNAFWMASDPASPDSLLYRDGKFSSYDNLQLYYAGVGGHANTFTRFRKYHGNGTKPVMKVYTDDNHLLTGNTFYQVRITIINGIVCYFLNNRLYWKYEDKHPYTQGYFGFRTTMSHQKIDNFRVYQIIRANSLLNNCRNR